MTEELRKTLITHLKDLYKQLKKNPVSELIPAEIYNLERQLGIDKDQELKDLGFSFNGFTGIITYTIKK